MLQLAAFACILTLAVAQDSSTQGDTLESLTAQLPPALGYWPLNKRFGANDASKHQYHGKFRSTNIVAVDGPLGNDNSAYTFGADNSSYVEFVGSQFNLKDDSFTISMFVKISNEKVVAPLLEFPMPSGSQSAYGLNLWMWPDRNSLTLQSMTAEPVTLECSFDGWAFVGAVYNSESHEASIFCNQSVSERIALNENPLTSDIGFAIGRSVPIFGSRDAVLADGRIASLSIFKKALSRSEIVTIYKLHKVYAEEPCSSLFCQPETCYLDLSETGNKYTCKCKSGEFSDDCTPESTTTTTSTTQAPTTTMMASTTEEMFENKMMCEEPGYTGENCDIAMCDPLCEEGFTCSSPNTCSPVKSDVAPSPESEEVVAGMSTWFWVIIVVAIVVAIILLIVIICCCCRKKSTDNRNDVEKTGEEAHPLNAR